MAKFIIDIVSDTVCPWCYVGYRHCSEAITKFQSAHPDANHTFSINWLPYYLNPHAPKTSVDKSEYYRTVLGFDTARISMVQQRLVVIGKASGIAFAFGGKTGNTRDSHRLIQIAKEHGKQTAVVEHLFKAYFEGEQDITDHRVLAECAAKARLDEAQAVKWLEGDAGGEIVDREVAAAKRKGVMGVPFFTINGSYEVRGAQDVSEFVSIFEQIANIE